MNNESSKKETETETQTDEQKQERVKFEEYRDSIKIELESNFTKEFTPLII